MPKRYSDSVVAEGPLIFVSGQTPVGPDGGVAGDAFAQTRQVLSNIDAVLARHGADSSDLVKLTYYLRHVADLDDVRSALDEYLVHEPRPAATLVEVGGFVDPRFLLEVDAVARMPRGTRAEPGT
ncbi:RidA family protein [Streptomonospora nanhaiensis]|uniref:Enamine deaminase RidA (YjgF/YER057c/UK114 family) n=1 Tax=Streptomonospora nanhaiensis TaxID=1323731 RepID=A0A853BV34_9ACTN|nr:RidA family protein [Streptomonospora nanhaiensis]MBV2362561.1 RidA family protein [Streptomonospora nanhaiensis]MBX9386841.1 RidA family protein [Streptomonospora nanhaiensis]NYI98092.1 enamine deaminase RidA (YjgF/YER057c/UK114 family) [Streptomonospora nanhaiensis]